MSKIITYQYVRMETDISQNVETAMLDNPIKWAQDQLEFLLGRELFDEIYAQAITNPTSFSAVNSALFDPYIKQFLAWTAYHDYICKANSYETRTGVRVFKEENSDPASDGMMNTRIKLAAQKVEFYKGRMISYILEQQNSGSFTTYKDCGKKLGSGFGITGVSRISTSEYELTKNKTLNGY